MSTPRRGEIRVVSHDDVGVRLMLVTHSDDSQQIALCVLLTDDVEARTDVDLTLPADVTGLPFDLVAQGDLEGPVAFRQLGEPLGTGVPEAFLEALGALRDDDDRKEELLRQVVHVSGDHLRSGPGLGVSGPEDRRWALKGEELEVLDALTSEAFAMLELGRHSESDGTIDLVAGTSVDSTRARIPSIWLRVPMEDGVLVDANVLDLWIRIRRDPSVLEAADLARRIGVQVRPYGSGARAPVNLPPTPRTRLGLALLDLAVAEARVAAQPRAAWLIDSTLALGEVVHLLALDASSDLRATLEYRLRELVDFLEEQAEVLAWRALRDAIAEMLDPLSLEMERVGGLVERFRSWVRAGKDNELPRDHAQVLTLAATSPSTMSRTRAPSEVPVALDVLLSGVTDRGAQLIVQRSSSDDAVMTLEMRPEVRTAHSGWRAAVTEWEQLGRGPARDAARRQAIRWRLVLRSLVRVGSRDSAGTTAFAGSGTEEVTAEVLPRVWVQLFDPDSGNVEDAFPLEPTEGRGSAARLMAVVPRLEDRWRVHVTTVPGPVVDRVDFRNFILAVAYDPGLAVDAAYNMGKDSSGAERAILLRLAASAASLAQEVGEELVAATPAAEIDSSLRDAGILTDSGRLPDAAYGSPASSILREFVKRRDSVAWEVRRLLEEGRYGGREASEQEILLTRARGFMPELQQLDDLLL